MPNAMIGTGSKRQTPPPSREIAPNRTRQLPTQVPILKLTRSQRAKCAGVPCRGGIRVFFSGGLILRPRLEGSAPARAAACKIVERRATVDEDGHLRSLWRYDAWHGLRPRRQNCGALGNDATPRDAVNLRTHIRNPRGAKFGTSACRAHRVGHARGPRRSLARAVSVLLNGRW
jgi:hypothetical protein